jgi:hypothetical protein
LFSQYVAKSHEVKVNVKEAMKTEGPSVKAEVTNYGNGRVTQVVNYGDQMEVTKAEMSKMAQSNGQKADLNNYFLQFVETSHESNMKEAMKSYIPGKG